MVQTANGFAPTRRFEFTSRLPPSIAVGIVVADDISDAPASDKLAAALADCVQARKAELDPGLDARRRACREMLRHGRYKPTGRGKPASEYLLRSALDDTFPSINGLVDANNLVSLEHMIPISVWDLELAGAERFLFRLGRPGESYVFNQSGQLLELEDLVVGCAFREGSDDGVPIVNPVKDALATKTRAGTKRVAAAVYCPLSAMSEALIVTVLAELAGWLCDGKPAARTASGVLLPGKTLRLLFD